MRRFTLSIPVLPQALDGITIAHVSDIRPHARRVEALLSSGFHTCSVTRSRGPIEKTSITRIEHVAGTQLLVRLTPVLNAKAYQLQMSTNGDGGWRDAGVYTQSRRVVLEQHTPGTTYTIRARAIGGTTGCSDWCDPVARMAT